ncbi:hypothetical protein D3C76_203740 [compost metagenome]
MIPNMSITDDTNGFYKRGHFFFYRGTYFLLEFTQWTDYNGLIRNVSIKALSIYSIPEGFTIDFSFISK